MKPCKCTTDVQRLVVEGLDVAPSTHVQIWRKGDPSPYTMDDDGTDVASNIVRALSEYLMLVQIPTSEGAHFHCRTIYGQAQRDDERKPPSIVVHHPAGPLTPDSLIGDGVMVHDFGADGPVRAQLWADYTATLDVAIDIEAASQNQLGAITREVELAFRTQERVTRPGIADVLSQPSTWNDQPLILADPRHHGVPIRYAYSRTVQSRTPAGVQRGIWAARVTCMAYTDKVRLETWRPVAIVPSVEIADEC